MWKEVVVDYFKFLSWNLAGRIENEDEISVRVAGILIES
jgi:hypothetical protein